MAVGATRGRLLLAYAAVYLLWGSSYFAMKVAVETMRPFPMAGARYFLAGVTLFGLTRWRTGPVTTPAQWRAAAIVGVALMGSNAAVAFAVTRIPSGVAALLVAMTPAWMLLLGWLADRAHHPGRRVLGGTALGSLGIVVLIGPSELLGADHVDPFAALAVLGGTLTWAWGSVYGRRAPRPRSAALQSGMQMAAGGAALLLVTALAGGASGGHLGSVSARSWAGFAWLVAGASLGGFTAYVYLLAHTTVARASTYAFVNPLVAVTVGALFGGEPLTPRVLLAATVIVAGVALIVLGPAAPATPQGTRGDTPS